MKKRILSIMLALCMVLMLCPVTTLAGSVPKTILLGGVNEDCIKENTRKC